MTSEESASLPEEMVTDAAASALGRPVTSVTPFDQGMNDVYRVHPRAGPDAVIKIGTVTDGTSLLSGPILLDRVASETSIPVPDVLAVVSEEESPIGQAYFLTEYVDGVRTDDVFDFSPVAHEQLVEEAGRHLAALHELPYEGSFGRLHGIDGELAPDYEFDSWVDTFRAEADHELDGFQDRFLDLKSAIRAAFAAFPAVIDAKPVDKSILYRDYHPKNLIFAPNDDADPLVRAVVDFNFRPVGDAPLDVAIAEANLVDLPIGGTNRAERFRESLRTSYVGARGGTYEELFDERYPYYRLFATLDYWKYIAYWGSFAREDDLSTAVERLRAFVRSQLEALR